MGWDVFVIHASTDKAHARRLTDALNKRKISAFLDERDIEGGAPWTTQIIEALRESAVQAVLVGEDERWYQSAEIERAIANMRSIGAKDRILPVLLVDRPLLPHGLESVQAIRWDGPEAVADRIAAKVVAVRGAPGSARVRVGVAGFWRDMPDALERLRTRIGQRTAILDGEVLKLDLATGSPASVDVRIMLLGERHHGRLDEVRVAFSESRELAAAVETPLTRVAKEYRGEALELADLLDGHDAIGTLEEMIDRLDEKFGRWHTARFKPNAGASASRHEWEERYLRDRAPLWRKGDASAMRAQTGSRVERPSWYVHLKAAAPWAWVNGKLRYEVSTRIAPYLIEYVDHEASRLVTTPRELWWARTDTRQVDNDGSSIFLDTDVDSEPPWLDTVLSHPLLPRCVVVGEAGTGKTVLLQHLASALAVGLSNEDHHLDLASVRGASPIDPVPVLHTATTLVAHLRDGQRPIREALIEMLRSSDTFGDGADPAELRAGFDLGRYVLLIDSLDEVPRREDRKALVDALGTLSGPTPRVVLTTRPSSHTDVERPSGFHQVKIARLDRETSDRLVAGWVTSFAPSFDLGKVNRAIEHVRTAFPGGGQDLSPVENPLLLTCVLRVYTTHERLPDDTAKLYFDMVRILCEAKVRGADDLHKDTMVERHREALRALFLASQLRGGTRLPVDVAIQVLVEHRITSRSTAETFLQTLSNQTGLFRFEGTGDDAVIRPWHRSFQEFLAAEAIALEYANQSEKCVDWLCERFDESLQPSRLYDGTWQGFRNFLVGAALYQNRSWAVGLVEAMVREASEPGFQQGHLWAIAARAVAEYMNPFFANERIGATLPNVLASSFSKDGALWQVSGRVAALEALARLGDPRLPDPRLVKTFTLDTGWAWVEAGEYTVGGGGNGDEHYVDERRVATRGFWVRRWPVTVGEFETFVTSPDTAYFYVRQHELPPCTSAPMSRASWSEARRFCRWAQSHWSLPGDGVIDLPTSAEWEIAARRHTNRIYPWGDDGPARETDARAAFIDVNLASEPPVGAFPRGHTPEGLWDMAGTVFEWCATGAHDGIDYPIEPDPATDRRTGYVVYRGGSWRRDETALPVRRVGDHPPSESSDQIGFRVVCRPR